MSNYSQKDTVKNQVSILQMLRKTWPFMKQNRLLITITVVSVLIYCVAGRLLPLVFGWAVDEGIKLKSFEAVIWYAGAYLVVDLIRVVSQFGLSYYSQCLGNRTLYNIRERLISHVQHLRLQFFDKNPVGRTVTRITNDVMSLGELFNFGFKDVIVNLIEIGAILITMLFISVPLTLIALVASPFMIFLTIEMSKKVRQYFGEAKRKLAQINAYTAESLNGFQVIQLYNQANVRENRFKSLTQSYKDEQISAVFLFAKLWPVLNLFSLISIVVCLIGVALFNSYFGLSEGQVLAFVLLIESLFRPIRVILERYNQLQNSLASADRIFTLLAEPEESRIQAFESIPELNLKGDIEFKDLSFSYTDGGPAVLKNINLKIVPGESIALVGRTGSGKTTLISLLMQLYDHSIGQILVDGTDINEIPKKSLRRAIGIVQQDPMLFRGTLYENITLKDSSFTREHVEKSARMAYCGHLLDRTQKGLDFMIEERGNNLSQGEKQLIAFARILCFDPDVLILDEATANIDSVNEQRIQMATEHVTKGRTSLIIAHRLSTIVKSDRILVMSAGEIIESGNHKELLKQDGTYAQMYKAQSEGISESLQFNSQETPERTEWV